MNDENKSDLNEALLWLAQRQGRISFSVSLDDRIQDLDPPAPTVVVEAMSAPVEDAEQEGGKNAEPCYGACEISAGNCVGALFAAINRARGN